MGRDYSTKRPSRRAKKPHQPTRKQLDADLGITIQKHSPSATSSPQVRTKALTLLQIVMQRHQHKFSEDDHLLVDAAFASLKE